MWSESEDEMDTYGLAKTSKTALEVYLKLACSADMACSKKAPVYVIRDELGPVFRILPANVASDGPALVQDEAVFIFHVPPACVRT